MMTNTRCSLPEKSWRAQKKGYEEVHVPAAVNTEASKIPLVPVDALPAWTRPAFAGMRTLNTVQSKLLPAALRSSQNLLLCAPTGAGKTNVAVLAMLSCLAAHRQNAEDDACCRFGDDAHLLGLAVDQCDLCRKELPHVRTAVDGKLLRLQKFPRLHRYEGPSKKNTSEQLFACTGLHRSEIGVGCIEVTLEH